MPILRACGGLFGGYLVEQNMLVSKIGTLDLSQGFDGLFAGWIP